MLEPVLSPFFRLGSSKTPEEISDSVRKIEQFVLPILAAAATYYARASLAPAFVIHLTCASGATVAFAIFVRNWRASASSEPEVEPEPTKVEKEDGEENLSDVEEGESEEEEGLGIGVKGDGSEHLNVEEDEKVDSEENLSDVEEGEKGEEGLDIGVEGDDSEHRGIEGEKEAESSIPARDAQPEIERLSEEDLRIRAMLEPNVTWQELQEELDELAGVGAEGMSLEEQREAHEVSKARFQALLASCPDFQTSVQYCRPGNLTNLQFPGAEALYVTQDRFFVYKTDQTMSEKIHRYSQDEEKIHILTFPSRYDAAEFKWEKPPTSWLMPSQVDLQSKNEKLFALTNAYLANGGFNMMARVLNEENSECMRNGELLLADEKYTSKPLGSPLILAEELDSLDDEEFWGSELANIRKRVDQFSKETLSELELPCLETVVDEGKNPVHFILTAVPQLGAIRPYESLLKIMKFQKGFEELDKKGRTTEWYEAQRKAIPSIFSDEMKEKVKTRWEQSTFLRVSFTQWTTLANCMAQFEYAFLVAQKNPKKEIVLHFSELGLGSNRNLPNPVATGIIYASHFFDERLRNENIANVTVAFERPDYLCDSATRTCANALLTQKGKGGRPLFSMYS